MRVLSLLTAMLCVTLTYATATAPPSFCNGLDCPLWTANSTCASANGSFEIRKYPSYKWVSFNMSSPSFDTVAYPSFMHLFNYLKATGVKMSAPVLTDIFAGQGPNCNSTFITSFFLDYVNQANPPPVPSSVPDDYIQTYPPLTVAVRSFSGFTFSWETEVLPQLTALAQQVTSLGIQVTPGREMVAVYDGPYNIFNRHNEVWLPIEGNIPQSCSL